MPLGLRPIGSTSFIATDNLIAFPLVGVSESNASGSHLEYITYKMQLSCEICAASTVLAFVLHVCTIHLYCTFVLHLYWAFVLHIVLHVVLYSWCDCF
jgi:hypothetical protein